MMADEKMWDKKIAEENFKNRQRNRKCDRTKNDLNAYYMGVSGNYKNLWQTVWRQTLYPIIQCVAGNKDLMKTINFLSQ